MKAKEEVNAKKERMGRDEAVALARSAKELYVAKGKKVVHLTLAKDKPDDDELAKLLLGPSGNLRAPTLRKGKTLVVGFNTEMYEELFD